ncbi:alanyl-tRNA editing protein [Cucumibacter marinus]|uniref:alanyl-tRNA editing protein n=1 Tax=Cucumibacter marinus TaxID=1121252 RepID=UPI00040A6252|nr:alanyl-tRNA editing protein [Cucumibacter marinus]
MTEFVFREEPYAKSIEAQVVEVNDRGGIVLDRTIFYANSGGQPGDTGVFEVPGGSRIEIATTIHPGDKTEIVHVPAEGQELPAAGDTVVANLDWDRRHRLMRMHTALHLLSVVFPFPVTGGSIGEDKGRLDFDMPEVPDDKDALEARLNEMIAADHPVTSEWITEEELDANPDMVKTMQVKPPRGQGRVRLIRIGSGPEPVDLQPCGGTHVASTGEIGPVRIGKIEKKGRQNRRVSLHFAEE